MDIVDKLAPSYFAGDPSTLKIAAEARAEIEKLRAALKLGRECVIESFNYVKSTDDQYLADGRLRDIDAALGND